MNPGTEARKGFPLTIIKRRAQAQESRAVLISFLDGHNDVISRADAENGLRGSKSLSSSSSWPSQWMFSSTNKLIIKLANPLGALDHVFEIESNLCLSFLS